MTSHNEVRTIHELDVKGLACPLPVLKTKKRIKNLASGDLLIVVATDPSSTIDFRAFCDVTSHTLEEFLEKDGVYKFHIRVNND